ncbi:uncharacterized protein BO97DRAFT_431995 [Aspergillus homomorphus CBS 101889]|uniref:Uncharacterized protein n=1 Tax=Aspergillus homomorphus (strain CBS 101889) TaxID=1450537 RepID=A0A395I5X6_ASPHC|nr:hypothetical protein BO97DRAFT_431995 [Aspergillus homomorphus CBS 101889]RAL15407.1 hypothetical protein BO97DRAFT_431995 [Aspergillus homomorphus CBS 101889]
MALRTSADNAEDVAAGFRLFRDPLPEHSTEITSLIADLYAISTSLKNLEDLTRNRTYRRNLHAIQPDLELVRTSLKYTLEDVVEFFGDLEGRRGSSREMYRRTWLVLCAFFREQSQDSLSTRLAKYKAFLSDLEALMKGNAPDDRLMSSLRRNLNSLLVQQESQVASQLGSLSLSSPSSSSSSSSNTSTEPGSPVSDRRPRTRRSYERARPSHHGPQSPTSASSATFSDIPPSAPDAPDSPSTTTATSHSTSSSVVGDHWARRVFLDEHTNTPIPYIGESSECLGEPKANPKAWLESEGFDELFQLRAFNGETDLRVCLYLRDEDHRARIVCKARRSARSNEYFILPLNMLEIVRVDSCLQLCRRRRGGSELVLWANLKFSTIEQMVIFFCTFLALRSQDSGRPVAVESIRDYELAQEEELFGGQIVDDDFLHALRVYRDEVSGAVRLQASVHKGELKRSPVWTAFITEHIVNPGWIRHTEPKVVVLRGIRRSIFTFPDYTPPQTAKGEHVLRFTHRSDAQGFMETIAELAHHMDSVHRANSSGMMSFQSNKFLTTYD